MQATVYLNQENISGTRQVSPETAVSGQTSQEAQLIEQARQGDEVAWATLVTILGLTFKEDIPDIRNTRVKDVVDELRKYNVAIQANDTYADPVEVRQKFNFELTGIDELVPGHAVVVCVPHQQYREMGWSLMQRCLHSGKGVVYDVKSVLPREDMPEGILLKRL